MTLLIDADSARALLRNLQWERESQNEGFEVWVSPNGCDEAIIPLNVFAGDYAGLMNRLVETLNRIRPVAIAAGGTSGSRPAMGEYRRVIWHQETGMPPGLIPWRGGESLHEQAGEQLAAAAKSTLEKRRYHGNRNPYIAGAFLDESLMVVPEAASFVVSALVPHQQSFFRTQAAVKRADSDRPTFPQTESVTGADILAVYQRALEASRECVNDFFRYGSADPFLDAVSAGLCYEMVRSLRHIVAGGTTEIAVETETATGGSPVRFDSKDAVALERGTEALAQDAEPEDVAVTGEVELLKRASRSDDRVVVLEVMSGPKHLKKIRLRLTEEQYDTAIDAHRTEQMLSIKGLVERDGNRYWMSHPRSLRLAGIAPERGNIAAQVVELGDLFKGAQIPRPDAPSDRD